jgi:hypothetical protein
MAKCLQCKNTTTNPKFCSKSCSVTFNNAKKPKRWRYRIGEGPQKKPCSRCRKVKALTAFTLENKIYPSSRCKVCTNELMKDIYARQDRAVVRRQKKYNLTDEDYQAMLLAQNGLCFLCVKRKAINVDHDHATGRVRGLLCSSCNQALGILGDTSAAFERVLQYVVGNG